MSISSYRARAIAVFAIAAIFTTTAGAQNAGSSGTATGEVQMVSSLARLDKKLDVKNLKVGDTITAKLVKPVALSPTVTLSEDTVLHGRLDQVQPSQSKSDSSLTVTFFKAQPKDGQPLAIKAMLQGLIPPPTMGFDAQGAPVLVPSPRVPKGKTGTIPGITLVSSPNEAHSGILTAKGKNLQLESGTTLQIALALLEPPQ